MRMIFYLLGLRYVVRGLNGLIDQVDEGRLKVLQGRAVVHPGLVQDQVHQEQRVLLRPVVTENGVILQTRYHIFSTV